MSDKRLAKAFYQVLTESQDVMSKYVAANGDIPVGDYVQELADGVADAAIRQTLEKFPASWLEAKSEVARDLRREIALAARYSISLFVYGWHAGRAANDKPQSKYVFTLDGKEFDSREAAGEYVRSAVAEWPVDSVHMLTVRARNAPEWHSATVAVYKTLPNRRVTMRNYLDWEKTLESLSEETEDDLESYLKSEQKSGDE